MVCNKKTNRCKGVHQCCHNNLLELLDFTVGLFEKHNIRYWLAYGTLLGAVRNKQIIPWDEDIDIGVMLGDTPRILPLTLEFFRAGYPIKVSVLNDGRVCAISVYYSLINELHIDISPYVTFRKGRSIKGVAFPGCTTLVKNILVANLITIELNGKMYKAPRNPEHILEGFYGTDWQRPKAKTWIKQRALEDPDIDPSVIDAIEHAGEYKFEPGRSVKE